MINIEEQAWGFIVSPDMERRIRRLQRIRRLYHAHPCPCRKLRKCHMRKVQRVWRKGMAHIERVERCELQREHQSAWTQSSTTFDSILTSGTSTRSTEEPLTLEVLEAAIEKTKKLFPEPTPHEVLLEQYLGYLGIRIGPWINLNPMGVDHEEPDQP